MWTTETRHAQGPPGLWWLQEVRWLTESLRLNDGTAQKVYSKFTKVHDASNAAVPKEDALLSSVRDIN